MLKQIKNVLKKCRRYLKQKKISNYVQLASNSRYGDLFDVDLRKPISGRTYVVVGEKGIIDAKIIFEKETGKVIIGNRCLISGTIISVDKVEIGDDVIIAWDTLLYDHNSHSLDWEKRKFDNACEYDNYIKYGDPCANKDWSGVKTKPIKICDKVWIGTGCKILKGVTIGEGAIIQAGSVVTQDVEAWTVVGGNPASILKRLK